MTNHQKIQYTAGELAHIIKRKLTASEFARVGVATKQYSLYQINVALDLMETKVEASKVSLEEPLGFFQTLLSGEKASEEGKKILEDLLG